MGSSIFHRSEIFINDINIDWIRELALENVREQKGNADIAISHTVCFEWQITPEGQMFWDAIRLELTNNEEIDLNRLSNRFRELDEWEVFRKVVEKHKVQKSLKEFINLI